MIEILPVTGIGEIEARCDLAGTLAAALAQAGIALANGDILVVTQKIVSKSEGRWIRLADIVPGTEAERLAEVVRKDPRFVELVLRESTAIVRAAPNVLITRHRLGHVMANAGIDRSNVGPGRDDEVLLLPEDPDGSAQAIAAAITARTGQKIGVLISDSFGRPWRLGVVGVAIGAAGLPALIDRRGAPDRHGRPLEVTQIGFGDLLAGAAALAAGEGDEGIPAVLVRGIRHPAAALPAAALVRPEAEDLFR